MSSPNQQLVCIQRIPSSTASATDERCPHPQSASAQVTSSDDEIDLLEVAAALKRHKTLIAGITAGAVLLSGFYAFTRKPIWEGQFQIVLENKDSNSAGRFAQLAANNPCLPTLLD